MAVCVVGVDMYFRLCGFFGSFGRIFEDVVQHLPHGGSIGIHDGGYITENGIKCTRTRFV